MRQRVASRISFDGGLYRIEMHRYEGAKQYKIIQKWVRGITPTKIPTQYIMESFARKGGCLCLIQLYTENFALIPSQA